MPQVPLPRRWTVLGAVALVLAGVAAGHAAPETGTLRILARFPVPAEPSPPSDIRWASDTSVYLSRAASGVSELKLAEGLPEIRRVVASAILGNEGKAAVNATIDMMGISAGNIMVATLNHRRAWTSVERLKDGTPRSILQWIRGLTLDLDVHGRQFVLLGESGLLERPWEDDAIAWLGTLDQGPQALKPLLFDRTELARDIGNCSVLMMGVVRFLADGSFVIVPGVQPGVHLFDPRGELKKSWDTAKLGVKPPRCAEMSEAEVDDVFMRHDKRLAWVNARRVIDEILPLPQGPGLLVRSLGAGGIVRWDLEVLGAGGVASYRIPLTSDRPFDRLRGDVRSGRIVLLRATYGGYLPGGWDAPGELIVLEVPR